MTTRALPRLLVLVRRIADALDRAYPSTPARPRRAEFSVASAADFKRGYDLRDREDG